MQVNDYSHLKPEEALRKRIYLENKIFAEQFHQNFFVKDLRSDVYFRNELRAFWEGRIQEFHGWSDIAGQLEDYIKDWVGSALDTAASAAYTSVDWAYDIYEKAKDAYEKASDVYDNLTQNVGWTGKDLWECMETVYNQVDTAIPNAIDNISVNLSGVWEDYIEDPMRSLLDVTVKATNSGIQWVADIWDKLTEISSTLQSNVPDIVDKVKNIWDEVDDIVSDVTSRISDSLDDLSTTVTDTIDSVKSSLSDTIQGVTSTIEDTVNGVISALKDRISSLSDTITSAIDDAISTLKDRVDTLSDTVTSAIDDAISGLKDWFENVRDTIISRVKDALEGISDALTQVRKTIVDTVKDTLESITDTVSSAKDTITSTLGDLRSKVLEGIEKLHGWITNNVVNPLTDKVKEAINSISDLSDFLGDVKGKILESLEKFHGWITNNVVNPIIDKVNVAVNWVENAPENFKEAWNGLVETVSSKFETALQALEALPKQIASAFQSAISYIRDTIITAGQKLSGTLAHVKEDVIKPVWSGLQWLRDWISGQVESAFATIKDAIANRVDRIKAGEWTAALELVAPVVAAGAGINTMLSVAGSKVLGSGIEVGEIGNFVNRLLDPGIITGAAIGSIIYAGVSAPMTYTMNNEFRPEIPSIDEATEMRRKDLISQEEFNHVVACQGYDEPYMSAYQDLIEEIPTKSDLVKFAYREVHRMPEDYPTPEFLLKYLKKHGISDYWARAYWWSHWEQPPFGKLQEAHYRGIINEDEIKQLIRWHDYAGEPVPGVHIANVDIMYKLIWDIPGKRDARWMLRWGVINKEEHAEILKWSGMHPDWRERIAEAEYREMLVSERTLARTGSLNLMTAGIIPEKVFRSQLEDLYFLPEEADFLVKRANRDIIQEQKEALIDAADEKFDNGILSLDEYKAALSDAGLQEWKIKSKAAVKAAEKKQPKRESTAADVYSYGRTTSINRFEDGVITEPELRKELKQLNYNENEIEVYVQRAKLERDKRFARNIYDVVEEAFEKGKIGQTKFIRLLKDYGFDPEWIQGEVTRIKLKHALMGGEEGGAS